MIDKTKIILVLILLFIQCNKKEYKYEVSRYFSKEFTYMALYSERIEEDSLFGRLVVFGLKDTLSEKLYKKDSLLQWIIKNDPSNISKISENGLNKEIPINLNNQIKLFESEFRLNFDSVNWSMNKAEWSGDTLRINQFNEEYVFK